VDSSSRRVLFLPPAPGPVVFFGMHTAFSAQFAPRGNPAAAHAVIAFSTQPTSEWIEYQDCLLFSCSSFNVMPSIAITLLIVSLLLRSFLVLYAQNDSRCPTSSCRLTSSSINMSIQPPSPRLIRNTIVSCIFLLAGICLSFLHFMIVETKDRTLGRLPFCSMVENLASTSQRL